MRSAAGKTELVSEVVCAVLRRFIPASFGLFRLARRPPRRRKAFDLLVNFWSERRDL